MNMYEHSERNGAQVMRQGSRPMKKVLFLGVGSVLMFTMGGVGSAQADAGPHSITTAVAGQLQVQISANVAYGAQQCAGCHRAHTAKTDQLLKMAQPALCYTCHDGTVSSLNVETGTATIGGGAPRGG